MDTRLIAAKIYIRFCVCVESLRTPNDFLTNFGLKARFLDYIVIIFFSLTSMYCECKRFFRTEIIFCVSL